MKDGNVIHRKNPFLLKKCLWNQLVLASPQNEEERVKTGVVDSHVTEWGTKAGILDSVPVYCVSKENLGAFLKNLEKLESK